MAFLRVLHGVLGVLIAACPRCKGLSDGALLPCLGCSRPERRPGQGLLSVGGLPSGNHLSRHVSVTTQS
jgi:hypothetical protein